jgi:hypothetical protein
MCVCVVLLSNVLGVDTLGYHFWDVNVEFSRKQ